MLTAIKKSRTENNVIYYLCKCDCGNKKEIRARTLRRGESKSCGCETKSMISKKHLADLSGKKFGLLTAVRRVGIHAGTRKPTWLCRCDCGNEKIIPSHSLMNGLTKSCGCDQYKSGEKHPRWKGGRQLTKDGYVFVYAPDNQMANSKGYVLEHRLNMANKLGRPLRKNETPHHKNGIRDDNRLRNLELWVKPQVPGQRAKDLLEFAKEIIALYGNINL